MTKLTCRLAFRLVSAHRKEKIKDSQAPPYEFSDFILDFRDKVKAKDQKKLRERFFETQEL
jgi:hypothetical protein